MKQAPDSKTIAGLLCKGLLQRLVYTDQIRGTSHPGGRHEYEGPRRGGPGPQKGVLSESRAARYTPSTRSAGSAELLQSGDGKKASAEYVGVDYAGILMALFRRRTGLPQIRQTGTRRSGGIIRLGRRERLPRIGYAGPQRGRRGKVLRPLIGVAVVLLLLTLTARKWLPLISLVVPDRYVMAYAPDPIQQAIFEIDPAEQIPTPAIVDESAAASLLSTISPTATPTPAPSTAEGGSGAPAGYVQPTPLAVAPTPTLTPVFSYAVDPRAEDRENRADLSQASYLLTGFNWEQQGYNNCGPASIRVLMSYWGVDFTEEEAASFLKPNPEDPNVRPDEIATFVEQYGYQAIVREGGNIELIKEFILAGYPVLIETGYDPEPETIGWTSHYLTLVGFSDADQQFIAMDTYRRPNWAYPYQEIDTYWRQFNRRYIIVHRPDQAAAVASIIGEAMDDETMYTNALYTAQFELSLDRSDPFGWFNLGTSLVGLGRYEDAATAFDQARQLGLPSRFLWYQFAPFEAYLQVGRYDDVLTLADDVLGAKATEEAFYYRGLAYAAQGDIEEARRQLNQALRFNRNYEAARLALDALGEE